jgi:DNA invertase Pin-like site-specific DNA recombinase
MEYLYSMTEYVAYYRVSTKQQERSGLGLESQRQCVTACVSSREGVIVADYTEVESGRKRDRPELDKAIQEAKKRNAVLIIAKLDRLSRNASFTLKLLEERVKFIACDLPDANDLTIGIMALLAQQEAKWISERTKAALQEKKKQGFKLGTPANLTNEARQKGAMVRKLTAKANPSRLMAKGYAQILKEQGRSFRAIAETLNNEGFRTPKNGMYQAVQVLRLLA